jgi:hypothetical protein
MRSVVFAVEQLATGLYILTAVGIFFTLRRWMYARGEYRSTYYELERNLARYQRGNAFTTLVLLLEFALIVSGIQLVVAPTIRNTSEISVSVALDVQDGDFRTFTPEPIDQGAQIDSSGIILGEQNPADLIQPTPTITPTPVGTIIPNSPPADCPDERVQLQIPANGMVVFEPIAVVGVATVDNFAYYRFELRGESTTGNFATLERDYTEPIPAMGTLGQFVPAFYRPGLYQFRVAVFDLTNAMMVSCTVNIYISEPIPTATPLATQSS